MLTAGEESHVLRLQITSMGGIMGMATNEKASPRCFARCPSNAAAKYSVDFIGLRRFCFTLFYQGPWAEFRCATGCVVPPALPLATLLLSFVFYRNTLRADWPMPPRLVSTSSTHRVTSHFSYQAFFMVTLPAFSPRCVGRKGLSVALSACGQGK